jgi:hypothetical protein
MSLTMNGDVYVCVGPARGKTLIHWFVGFREQRKHASVS